MMPRSGSRRSCALLFVALLASAGPIAGQQGDTLATAGVLKHLSLEELMNLEVTSVSKRPEKLSVTASAIQVISAEAIRRSGATSLPEALRLASNLQVAEVNASQWAVSARGFNSVLANKLLILIDGRTIYTPLYAGVFWDVQNPPLSSIERIEVISGPGGALWGANAVNGVINIVTRGAEETQGLAIEGGAGTELQGAGMLRYGGRLGPKLHARVYGEGFSRGSTKLTTGGDARDDWHLFQGGLRMDGTSGESSTLTLQGDVYDGRPDPDGGSPVVARGGNVLGRWTRAIAEGSELQVQLYYDRAYRDFGNGFTEDLATYDGDWQHRFQLGRRQEVVWGLGVRLMDHRTDNLQLFAFTPGHKLLHLYSGFVQDQVLLVPDRLQLTLGTKLEHNDYTGLEVQPSGRLAWTPSTSHTIWAAVSRAVRTPSRLDRDFFLSLAPGVPFIVGNGFTAEQLLAYELGWRLQPSARLSLSVSTFWNDYDNLRSVEPGPPPSNLPVTFRNGVQGHSYGVELSALWQAADKWRLRGGCTLFRKDLEVKPGSGDLNSGSAESDDPEQQCLLQSMLDLPAGFKLDGVLRYVDALPAPHVPSYVGLDVRLAWAPTPVLELSVVGQNLLKGRHLEFQPSSPSPREVERRVYGKVTWR